MQDLGFLRRWDVLWRGLQRLGWLDGEYTVALCQDGDCVSPWRRKVAPHIRVHVLRVPADANQNFVNALMVSDRVLLDALVLGSIA